MRRIACGIRREKDTAVAAQAAGDDQLRVDCQLRINHLSGLYKQVTDASGLTPRRERMTVEEFKRAKVPENAEKVLTSGAESGILNIGTGAFHKYHQKYPDAGFQSFLVDYHVKKPESETALLYRQNQNMLLSFQIQPQSEIRIILCTGWQSEELRMIICEST